MEVKPAGFTHSTGTLGQEGRGEGPGFGLPPSHSTEGTREALRMQTEIRGRRGTGFGLPPSHCSEGTRED